VPDYIIPTGVCIIADSKARIFRDKNSLKLPVIQHGPERPGNPTSLSILISFWAIQFSFFSISGYFLTSTFFEPVDLSNIPS
jgi:hypothetical protein